MALPKYSSISEFYNGKSVFITGSTGFLGKVIVEKLLRSCEGIEKVYLLVRPKKNKTADDRLISFLKSAAFDLIKEKDPKILDKIVMIEGDIAAIELGISKADQQLLCEKVSVVINSAATINFDEVLKVAVFTNVRSLRELIRLSRNMKHLESFIHISTSYSNWFEHDVEEKFYSARCDPHAVIGLCETMSDDELDKIQPILLGKHVNTYTFTKALAENLALQETQGMPFGIVRPSGVCPSIVEPKVGWVDSYTALVPFIDTIQAGIYRSGVIGRKNVLDVVPVDMVSNLTIAVSWKVANDGALNRNPPIYHSSSATSNPIIFEEMYRLTIENAKNFPPSYIAWMPQLRYHETKLADNIDKFFTGFLFVHLMDFLLVTFGQKPKAAKAYDRIMKMGEVLSFAHTQSVRVISKNYKDLMDIMSKNDQKEFFFDPATINWPQYNQDMLFGIRKYIWRESGNPADSFAGKKKLRIIKIVIFMLNILAIGGGAYGLKKGGEYLLSKL